MNILVSACLLGIGCRFDGTSKEQGELMQFGSEKYTFIPVCPEIYGGLSTPREASEKLGDRVVDKKGNDVTDQFQKGAKATLKLAKLYHASYAILKEKSPSCGFGRIYDGSFSGQLIDGNGVTAELLSENGLQIIGESHLEEFLDKISKMNN